ncbi:hypothetical protein OG897_35525 [Streptomyces sp. NBC_00237]|uniref:hypothetical protein n=1 Tax=Streptomyces sp. NBC_00237 TaxID=2975687 RepID=UPI00224F7DCC|nr:hypothetical protein [Streptomyces sp. NBC_00237]MCX5206702.1 hypothetical protein [Streptomyces sp. NBC_00237]
MTTSQPADHPHNPAQTSRTKEHASLTELRLFDALTSGTGCTVRVIAGRVTVLADHGRHQIRAQRLTDGQWGLISSTTVPHAWAVPAVTPILQPVEEPMTNLLLEVHARLITAMADGNTLLRRGDKIGRKRHAENDFEAVVFDHRSNLQER